MTADALLDFLQSRVAKWWLPERWTFIDEVPKTSVGKFDKKVLRAQYADGLLDVETVTPGSGERSGSTSCAPVSRTWPSSSQTWRSIYSARRWGILTRRHRLPLGPSASSPVHDGALTRQPCCSVGSPRHRPRRSRSLDAGAEIQRIDELTQAAEMHPIESEGDPRELEVVVASDLRWQRSDAPDPSVDEDVGET